MTGFKRASVRGEFSSAHKRLAGTTMKRAEWDRPRIIEEVLKPAQRKTKDERLITFTDGTYSKVTSKFLREQAEHVGSGVEVPKKIAQGPEVSAMAVRSSLLKNKRRFDTSQWTEKDVIARHREHQKMISDMGTDTVRYTLVRFEGTLVPISQEYADIAIAEGWATRVGGF